MKREIFGGILIAVVMLVLCFFIGNSWGKEPSVKNEGVLAEDGVIVYSMVNFRSSPSSEDDSNDIGDLHYGDVVSVLEHNVDGWSKVIANGKTGFVISESVSPYRMIIDISDYNWGKDKEKAINWMETLVERAENNLKLGGFYVQVTRTEHVNRFWVDIVQILEREQIPYGLYFFTPATTQEGAKEHYELFKSLVDAEELKFNKLPMMIDLEQNGNQSEALKFMNTVEKDYIVYSNASSVKNYAYNELAPTTWIAHYKVATTLPTKLYKEYFPGDESFKDAVMWQFTSTGNTYLLNMSHLDISIIQDEDWYIKYVK